MKEILKIRENDRVELKKPHPCGSTFFDIVRVGSDVRIICAGCGRDLVIPRIKLEKAIKKIITKPE